MLTGLLGVLAGSDQTVGVLTGGDRTAGCAGWW